MLSGNVFHSLFTCVLSFTLSSKIPFEIRSREFGRSWQIHCMDKICHKLAIFETFTTAVLQTVAERCFSSHTHFF